MLEHVGATVSDLLNLIMHQEEIGDIYLNNCPVSHANMEIIELIHFYLIYGKF